MIRPMKLDSTDIKGSKVSVINHLDDLVTALENYTGPVFNDNKEALMIRAEITQKILDNFEILW